MSFGFLNKEVNHKIKIEDDEKTTYKYIIKQFNNKKIGSNDITIVIVDKVIVVFSRKTNFHSIVSNYNSKLKKWIIYEEMIEHYIKKIL